MNRVNELSDRPEGAKHPNIIPFKSLVPLAEIISSAIGVGKQSKRVENEYQELINSLGSEFEILLEKEKSEIEKFAPPLITEGIMRAREGNIKIEPGFDGEFGKIKIFSEKEKEKIQKGDSTKQSSLF